jgi:transcription elongation factor Elf1
VVEKSNYLSFLFGGFVEEFDNLTKRKYLVDPYHCPFCGVHGKLESTYTEAAMGQAFCRVICNGCQRSFMEIYSLTDIEMIEDPVD